MKDALGAPPSVRPTADTATCMDDGSSRASSAYDIEDTTGRATPTTSAPNVPSFTCSPVDAAIGCASPVDVMAALTPLSLTSSVALVSS